MYALWTKGGEKRRSTVMKVSRCVYRYVMRVGITVVLLVYALRTKSGEKGGPHWTGMKVSRYVQTFDIGVFLTCMPCGQRAEKKGGPPS